MDERKSLDELEILSPRELGEILLQQSKLDVVDTKYLKDILRAGAPLEAKDLYYGTPLHIAVINRNIKLFKFLLRAGASIDSEDRYGRTPLHMAARDGYIKIVQSLLDAGADLDAKDDGGQTALHYAAIYNRVDVAKVLVAAGANIGTKNRYGDTPWDVAGGEAWYSVRTNVPKLNPNYNG